VALAYRAPVNGLRPDFSPYGTEVRLSDLPAGAPLPPGAARPAKTGTMQIGPDQKAWIRIFGCVGFHPPPGSMPALHRPQPEWQFPRRWSGLTAVLTQNPKNQDMDGLFRQRGILRSIRSWHIRTLPGGFLGGSEDEQAPDVIMYSVRSWRSGSITVDGIKALVAVMDSNNDAVFTSRDDWSVLAASEIGAPQRVLPFGRHGLQAA